MTKELVETVVVKANAKELVRSYKEILVHVEKKDFRPILATVNHMVENNKLTLVATDTHSLGKFTLDCESNGSVEVAIPRKVIQALSKLKNKELVDKEIILEFTKLKEGYIYTNEVKYIVNGKEFISSNTETNYPSVERILPVVNEDRNITFNIRELKEFIKHVKETGYHRKNWNNKTIQSNIKFIKGQFVFSYECEDDEGEVFYKKENINCDVTKGFTDDYDINLNIYELEKHVNKFLTGNKTITLAFVEKEFMNSQNVRPIQVTYNGMKNYVGVLAPMRAFR